ncbi:squalene/phytoene synthase family protein [Pikeienuella sp. HZG-20]|uniref:squalene/phytoene synthase family protein n=1 Tax=Paludibacillus litoralis TaxID=3133267 RepID=UPI0030ED980F
MAAPPLSTVGNLAREGDETRFLAALCAPPQARERLFALIAFNLELAKIPALVSEPMLGEIRLAWWREALEDLFDRGVARGHEVIGALAAAHREAPFDRAALETMVEARLYSLAPGGADDREGLDRFLAGTGGALAVAGVRALGGGDAAAEVAGLGGWAEGAGRLIAALPAIIASGGQAPMTAGLDMNAIREGRAPETLTGALRDLADDALTRLRAARARRREVPRAARAPLLSIHAAEPALVAAAAPGFDPFRRVGPSPLRARLSLLRRAATGRF